MNITCLPVSIFNDICSGRMSMTDWAAEAKKIGYDGFDVSIMFLKFRTQTYLKQLKAELRQAGIPLVMMTTYPDLTNPDPLQREREMQYLKADVALSSELNVKYLRILAGQAHPETDSDETPGIVSDCFHEIDAYAKKFGVGLLFENHGKPGAWDTVDYTFEPRNFMKIYEKIQDTDIYINFDTGNITAHGEDPMDFLPLVFERIRTVHVTDMAERGKFSPTVIGTGVTPNAKCFLYLKEHGYQGWLSIEEASGHGLEGIGDAYRYVKHLWEIS